MLNAPIEKLICYNLILFLFSKAHFRIGYELVVVSLLYCERTLNLGTAIVTEGLIGFNHVGSVALGSNLNCIIFAGVCRFV